MRRLMADTVQLRRGTVTLPKSLREKYDLDEGDVLHVVDVDGAFVLTPVTPVIPKLTRDIERLRHDAGETTEGLLSRLREERMAVTHERYGSAPNVQSSDDVDGDDG